MKAGAPVRALLATAALVLPLVALARAPYTPPGARAAALRLSWRLAAPAAERCRPRTAEELAALPAHMRSPEVCERDVARYSLVTRVDDEAPDTLALEGGGVKGDRPLFVLEERRLPPGSHRVRVELWRDGGDGGDGGRRRVAALDTVLPMEAGRARVVTLAGGRMEVR